MKVDYIIVGCGLAGIAFCEELRRNKKSFVVFDDASQQSSMVAGGLYNPVVLKRFTMAWKAMELLKMVTPFYTEIENNLNIEIVSKSPIFRIFNSVEEQNNWFTASDKPLLSEVLSDKLLKNSNTNINANFGLGEVFQAGKIDTVTLVNAYINCLKKEEKFVETSFDYNKIIVDKDKVQYQGIEADFIVFADGFGLKENPYFKYLPLIGSKGEYIVIESKKLKLKGTLKGSIFIIPLKEETYLVGATYDNFDKTNQPTEEAKHILIDKLKTMIHCDFSIIDHIAGIRPTVKDRRPLVGKHPIVTRLAVINGLGTRGVMASPYLAQQLFNHLENRAELDSEIDIQRFEKLFIS